jgi:hypothetical protein
LTPVKLISQRIKIKKAATSYGVSQLFKIKNAAGTFWPTAFIYFCFFILDQERNTMAAGYG